jgi:hypothetical protein
MRTRRSSLAVFALAALLVPIGALAYPRDDAALVEVDVQGRADIARLNELSMDIVSVRDGRARIAAVPDEVEALWANGFRPVVLMDRMKDAVRSLDVRDRGEYHSYSELTADLQAWAAEYPSITKLVSIGQSVLGREIWALKISDNAAIEEDEPEIQWIGCHHGNETISVEVPYYMAEYLLTNYGTDPQVTWLVNEREIWIIPLFNPDGHEAGSRYNANGEDLNRNYLCPNGSNASTAFSEPETQALRAWDIGQNAVTSLTFHSGSQCVNYLWDYTYSPTPDEPLIITISNGYASYNGYWVTNGADWYIAIGTCQDWCYDTRGEIDTTIELSDNFEPPASQIDAIFEENRRSMLYQARQSGHGIRGLVTDAETGDPIYATISIPEIGKDVYTDPDVGDYHRMVESGTYTVVASAEGYPTQTVYNVSASLDTFVVVNFQMEPPPRGTVAGYVTDDQSNPLAATVELTDMGGFSAETDPGTGYYEIPYIPVGLHDLRASASGHSTVEHLDVQVEDGTTATENFILASPLFFDDFESGSGNWTGAWSLTTAKSASPTHSLTDSPAGNYPNGASTTTTLASAIDLSQHSTASLSFQLAYDTEAGYDYVYVDASGNGGTNWTRLASYSGSHTAWAEQTLSLDDFAGSSAVKIRFVLSSDGYITRDGGYVDDVAIFGDASLTGVDHGTAVTRLAVRNYPNPFNPKTSVRFDLPAAGRVDLAIYDVAGRAVRTLIRGETRSAGPHEVAWDGRDDGGREAAAGVYFVRVGAGGSSATGRMILLK